ncbi:hypothetical protein BMI86_13785 [Thioclava sp. DLFJ5-1]|uniref:hypothetical protein n=1 Tax=Thioclava sp. DLFJ5-1 TaxID=1915314 RepID=UPI0009968C57|nr:hypothetical protein [Thioclava sp. DLFJ5-1]OOY19696.1 hypothetical protein BMI86_13785 [Thioclava sp. DLFJ5-1]
MTYTIKSIALAGILATAAPVAALAQADVSTGTDAGASVSAQAAGADVGASADMGASTDAATTAGSNGGMGQDGSVKTYGQLVADLQANGAASTDQFADYEVGTDGEAEIVALSDLKGKGAENGSAALENAMGADVDADYSQLPSSVFDGTDYTPEDVAAAYINAEGNLIVVVDNNA